MPRALPPIDGATSHELSSSFVELVAGFTAGTAATLAVHPFDVLKTRLQSKAPSQPLLALLMLASRQVSGSFWTVVSSSKRHRSKRG